VKFFPLPFLLSKKKNNNNNNEIMTEEIKKINLERRMNKCFIKIKNKTLLSTIFREHWRKESFTISRGLWRRRGKKFRNYLIEL
jgi:hypothetical protein